MGLYRKYILPRATHFACSLRPAMQQREKVVPLAAGRVLEIGIGSGLNLPFYESGNIEHLWGLDPSRELWMLAHDRMDAGGRRAGARGRAKQEPKPGATHGADAEDNRAAPDFDIEFIEASAENIPLCNDSADTVLITYTLCSIPDVLTALGEIRRVLRQDGQLIFCEHGAAPDENVRRWQDRLNPVWSRFSGGCNLNRSVPMLLEQGGFRIHNMETMYITGWKPVSFNYWGTARPA